ARDVPAQKLQRGNRNNGDESENQRVLHQRLALFPLQRIARERDVYLTESYPDSTEHYLPPLAPAAVRWSASKMFDDTSSYLARKSCPATNEGLEPPTLSPDVLRRRDVLAHLAEHLSGMIEDVPW